MPDSLDALLDHGALPAAADVRAAAGAWLAHMAYEQGRADKTLEAYARDLTQFLGWLARELGRAPALADLAGLEAKRFRAFMAARRRQGCASRSLARSMSGLRAFFRWLDAEDVASSRAILQVMLPKVPHGIPKPLTVEKAKAVVEAGARADSTGSRRAMRRFCSCSTARACASPRRWR
jgi:integrase/recombinase XerC